MIYLLSKNTPILLTPNLAYNLPLVQIISWFIDKFTEILLNSNSLESIYWILIILRYLIK